jgi:hypothetical protein
VFLEPVVTEIEELLASGISEADVADLLRIPILGPSHRLQAGQRIDVA